MESSLYLSLPRQLYIWAKRWQLWGNDRQQGGLKELNSHCHSFFGRKWRLGPVGWAQ